MAHVIFYETPGCAECARQKQLLVDSGHELEIHDLTAEIWHASSLRPYFRERPIRDWFNPRSPRILSGEIDPDGVNPQAALVMMMLDPGLIRAPLTRIAGRCESGADREEFDIAPASSAIVDAPSLPAASSPLGAFRAMSRTKPMMTNLRRAPAPLRAAMRRRRKDAG
jgi:nitrogenase-associated protein